MIMRDAVKAIDPVPFSMDDTTVLKTLHVRKESAGHHDSNRLENDLVLHLTQV